MMMQCSKTVLQGGNRHQCPYSAVTVWTRRHTHTVVNTDLLLCFFGHQFMVVRNEKLVLAFLKVYILLVRFKVSERNGDGDIEAE